MEYIHGTSHFALDRDSAVTLGKFDGIHVGHQKLVSLVRERAGELGLLSCVFTFDGLPLSICPQKHQHFITTNTERREFFKSLGVDVEVEFPFTDAFLQTDPDSFVHDVIVGQLRAKVVVVGTDFHFGRNRAGNAEYLLEAGKKYDFETIIVEKEKFQEREISSTYIREELRLGHMETVNVLLGRPFSISGVVCPGNQMGKKMNIPTMNIYPSVSKFLPPRGVYASVTKMGGGSFYGVTNIGVKPTVSDENSVSVETYLFDYDESVYGCHINVELIYFIRPEMKFDSVEALAKQMESDAKFARSMFLV
jgi:riboflavin kinase/FMN adenylyltransferase